jgi:hypothetical protein
MRATFHPPKPAQIGYLVPPRRMPISERNTVVSAPSITRPSASGTARRERPRDRLGALLMLLVVVSAVPAAALVVPNTVLYVVPQAVRDLGPAAGRGLVPANGLALPALLLAVPLASVAARRIRPWPVLLAALFCLLAGILAARSASTVELVGAVRVLQGLGGGALLPPTLILAWQHGHTALWAGVLAASLLSGMAFALHAVPLGGWRGALEPAPWIIGIALAATGLHGIARGGRAAGGLPALRHNERTQLLLPVVPAAAFAFLAVVTTFGWSPGAQLIVASVGLAALLGLAFAGSKDATAGSPLAFAVVMVTVGLLGMPVAGPLAGLLGTRAGPQAISLVPFALAAGAALAGALLSTWIRGRAAVLGGHGLAAGGVLLLLSGEGPWLAVLGLGLGLAAAGSLRGAGLGSALFGLTLCFPAVLTGHLVVGALQVAKVDEAVAAGGGAAAEVGALTTGFRIWLMAAAGITMLLAGTAALVCRGRTTALRRDG